jgi:hypothetical protein
MCSLFSWQHAISYLFILWLRSNLIYKTRKKYGTHTNSLVISHHNWVIKLMCFPFGVYVRTYIIIYWIGDDTNIGYETNPWHQLKCQDNGYCACRPLTVINLSRPYIYEEGTSAPLHVFWWIIVGTASIYPIHPIQSSAWILSLYFLHVSKRFGTQTMYRN